MISLSELLIKLSFDIRLETKNQSGLSDFVGTLHL